MDDNHNDDFMKRKYYEAKIWDGIRTKLLERIKENGGNSFIEKLITKLQEFISLFFTNLIDTDKFETFLEKLGKKFEEKTTGAFLSGIFNYSAFINYVGKAKRPYINDRGDWVKKAVKQHCRKIRTCLTLIDFIVKALEGLELSNGQKVMKYYVEYFDNCIRFRRTLTTDIEHYITNKDAAQNFALKAAPIQARRDAALRAEAKKEYNAAKTIAEEAAAASKLRRLDKSLVNEIQYFLEQRTFCVKDYKLFQGIIPQPEDRHCLNLPTADLIEKYPLSELLDIRNKYKKLYLPFQSGTNMFFLPERKMNTIDIFAAGISGHTAEIGLMMQLFAGKTKPPENMQKFVAIVCLIWMLDYFHHSFREILLASTIHFEPAAGLINEIEWLYSVGDPKESIEGILTRFDAIISSLFFDIDSIQFDNDHMKNMVNFMFLGRDIETIKDTLKNTERNLLTFKENLPESLKTSIVWPSDCNSKKVVEAREAYMNVFEPALITNSK